MTSTASPKNVEKDVSENESCGALEEVNSHIKAVFEILNSETTKARKEIKAFDTMAKKLKHVHFSKTLKLNVGGQLFSTSLDTMKKDPGSMLHAMFSGRFDSKPAEDGSYFIDRDGTYFRYILNYLRTGKLVVPEDKIVRKELFTEAEFYQVQGIIDELKACPFEDSSILSTEQRQTLAKWLEGTLEGTFHTYSLIYRASRNGWAASNFHSQCDHKGPTVTVIRSSKGYIFGGFTEQHWESHSGIYKEDPNAFLFSLANPYGLRPTKMSLIPGREGSAIYCSSSYGPVFGSFDLSLGNSPNQTNSCRSDLNKSFRCPQGQNCYADPSTFLAGNCDFCASEIEVFAFEK